MHMVRMRALAGAVCALVLTLYFQMCSVPDYMPTRTTHYAAFTGAAITSKCIGANNYISKADYENYGPNIVQKKC